MTYCLSSEFMSLCQKSVTCLEMTQNYSKLNLWKGSYFSKTCYYHVHIAEDIKTKSDVSVFNTIQRKVSYCKAIRLDFKQSREYKKNALQCRWCQKEHTSLQGQEETEIRGQSQEHLVYPQ